MSLKKMIEWTGGEHFSGINLAAYRSKVTGKAVIWKNEYDQDDENGPWIGRKKMLITDETPFGKELLAYLEDHPFKTSKGWFTIRDLTLEEAAENTKVRSKVDILAKYYSMEEDELRETLMMARLDSSGSFADLRMRVQRIADTLYDGVNKLYDGLVEVDRDYNVLMYKALDKGAIVYANNRYRLGSDKGELIGFSEDQVIKWLKDNEEEYGMLMEMMGSKKNKPAENSERKLPPAPPTRTSGKGRTSSKVEANSAAPRKPAGGTLLNAELPTP